MLKLHMKQRVLARGSPRWSTSRGKQHQGSIDFRFGRPEGAAEPLRVLSRVVGDGTGAFRD
jgi:hypothetical protein